MLSLLFQGPQGLGQTTFDTVMTLHTFDYVVRSATAAALGIVIAVVYRATHKGLSYSQSFTQTIVFVALIVALVMMTVRNSLATAFTLVGALSIIRFRTVVKDTRDTAFIFAALALGMGAGLGYWELAAIGTAVVCVLALLLYATNFGALYKSEFILRFTFDQSKDSAAYLRGIAEHAKRSNMLHIEPSGDGRSLRLTYDITLLKEATAEKLTAALSRTDGVSDVVLIVSKNDVDY
ncbi:MAG TPA: DUF4956 domain-containing protein [Planctomycetota bacterium]|nr:DUF4956 domain-containing protein [Planctomycetota bacterium]